MRRLGPLCVLLLAGGAPAAEPVHVARTAVTRAPAYVALVDVDGRGGTIADAAFPFEARIHRAHVVMLAEQGIITRAEACAILPGLDRIDERTRADASLHAYLPYEAALIKAVGPVAGKMHIGRSRNDLVNTTNRMYYRARINDTVETLLDLRRALAEKAAANIDTVMTVYTHRKQAQPVTLAHYLLAVDESIAKDIERYEQLYARMNQSPLGSAASAGTGFALDRERTARLLGFDGLVVNTIEGVAGWDHIAEFAAVNAITAATLSRLASEIQLWATDEYGLVALDPGYSGISSIMPQKLNASTSELTRRVASSSLGNLVSVIGSLNTIEYQHSAARVALEPRAIDAVLAAAATMAGVVRTMTPQPDRMLKFATEGFSTVTELADTIVRETGLSFRDAHEVVAAVVDRAVAAGLPANRVTTAMVDSAARDTIGRALKLPAKAVTSALDARENVKRRAGIGGPAPVAVRRMLETAQGGVEQAAGSLTARRSALSDAEAALNAAVSKVLN